MAFYAKAFGATEIMRLAMPGGGIAHAEMDFHGAKVMFSDENPQWGTKARRRSAARRPGTACT